MNFENIISQYDRSIFYFILSNVSFFSATYIFCNSLGIKLRKARIIYVVVSGLLLSIMYTVLKVNHEQLSNFVLFLLTPLALSHISENKIINSITAGLISLSLFQLAKVVSSLIVSILFWMIGYLHKDLLLYAVDLVFSSLLCVMLMKIKRFKKGIQVLESENNMGLGLVLSCAVLILTCIDLDNNEDKDIVFIIAIFGAIIIGFGLYLWIRRSITELYRKRQQLRTEEYYKEILEERDREIEKLNQSNAYLAKVVHRDNHLMSNLNTSIDMYFNSNDEAYKDNLLREVQTLSKERGEQINKEQLESKLLPSTGNLLIDSAIGDLYIKAAAHGIDFDLTVSSTVDEIIGKFISQTDLQTLLCDHIKDAIIAVESRGEEGGKILVSLSKQNDNYCIDIFDNGVAFEPETLTKLGLERVTTHADSGGSGIGFMTTFETLRKAYASLIITEFENRAPFLKSVSFRFDGESTFIIKTYRKEEIQALTDREDMTVLS